MLERDQKGMGLVYDDREKFEALKALITPDRTATRSGPWSDPTTWGGTVPQAGENVLIPLGMDVTYDVNDPTTVLGAVVVEDGAFRVPPSITTAIHLHTMLVDRGILQIGAPNAPVTGQFTLIFADEDFLAGDTAELGKQLLTQDARVSIIGQKKIPYARLTAGVTAGDTVVTLQDDVDPETGAVRYTAIEIAATWGVGDRIAIPPTDEYHDGSGDFTTVGTITDITGATITLASGAKAHPALGDLSNMSGAAYGIREKYTFQRKPWIINETRTILFRSANSTTVKRRGCLMFAGNHPPRNIGGHRDDLHRLYPSDLGPDNDPRHEFRFFAMEGLGRTEATETPPVGDPANPIGRWAFHIHHVGHWSMRAIICQGLSLTDAFMWGMVHDDCYVWFDWCTVRGSVGSGFTCIFDTEQGLWTRLFVCDVKPGEGGGERVHAGHGRQSQGYTMARQLQARELRAVNCLVGVALAQNETDPVMDGYMQEEPWLFTPVGRWPDREACKRFGGWPGDMALIKHEDAMMGNWDDFEFYCCEEGINVFHRQKNYMASETRAMFHRWNIWSCKIAIRTPNYTWNYTWRDSVFSDCYSFWRLGDKLSGFIFWNCSMQDLTVGVDPIQKVHNDGGGFVDLSLVNVGTWVKQVPNLYLDETNYNSDTFTYSDPVAAFDIDNVSVSTGISGMIRDMMTGHVPVDGNYGTGRIPMGYASQKHDTPIVTSQPGNITGRGFNVSKEAMTREHLVQQNGAYQDSGSWYVPVWLFMRERLTGEVNYHYVALPVDGVNSTLLSENEIAGPTPQPDYPIVPDLDALPEAPEAVSYFLDPVLPVTYRAVTDAGLVHVTLEASNRFCERAVGNDLQISRTFTVRDATAATDTAVVVFDLTAIGAPPVNTKAPELSLAGAPMENPFPVPTSQFGPGVWRLDRGRWSNTEGGWFEARLLKNGSVYTHSHHSTNANPALNRHWVIEDAAWQTGTWKLQIQFHNDHGSTGWVDSNEVVIS